MLELLRINRRTASFTTKRWTPLQMRAWCTGLALCVLISLLASPAAWAQTAAPLPGVVVMHGKGGSPNRHVKGLAVALQDQGFLVANLEMPWSGERDYDASLAGAEAEVDAAIARLRALGAQRIVVAGHSQGGMFALYYASRRGVDGVVALAPGGDPGSATPREKLAATVALARGLVASGHGDQKTELMDYEGAKGTYAIHTTPHIYLIWFDPDSDYSLQRVARRLPATLPVLYVAPTQDYPALVRANRSILAALPRDTKTELYEPNTTHLGAPGASIAKVVAWIRSAVMAY